MSLLEELLKNGTFSSSPPSYSSSVVWSKDAKDGVQEIILDHDEEVTY